MAHRLVQTIIFASILTVNAAFASGGVAAAVEVTPILMWVIGGLCTLLFSVTAFILSKVDRNQTRLFELRDSDHERIVKLETKCDSNHHKGA